jgi:scytovirin
MKKITQEGQVMRKFLIIAFLSLVTSLSVQAKDANYQHDESKNTLGANRCRTDMDCDGLRTCSPLHWCQGEAGHPAVTATPQPQAMPATPQPQAVPATPQPQGMRTLNECEQRNLTGRESASEEEAIIAECRKNAEQPQSRESKEKAAEECQQRELSGRESGYEEEQIIAECRKKAGL